jgi:multidrug efflux pump subunit AcrA (membrane-fusion protein)
LTVFLEDHHNEKFFSRFSRRTWIIIGAAIVVLIVIAFLNRGGNEVAAFQTTPAERGNLVASIGATGSVRARQSATLIWQTNGIVEFCQRTDRRPRPTRLRAGQPR